MRELMRVLLVAIVLAILHGESFSQEISHGSPFDAIVPLAKEGLTLYEQGVRTEETLQILQEALLRGQDWINLGDVDYSLLNKEDEIAVSEDAQLISNVVAAVTLLRRELREESNEDLALIMINSIYSIATRESNIFENVPNVYPDFKEIAIDGNESLRRALDLMAQGKMKDAEKILIILYYDSWNNGNNRELRHVIANKLGLYYLKMGLVEKCYKLLRTNKIEMEENGIPDKDYIETLVYLGFSELERYPSAIVGNLTLETASFISYKYGVNPDEVMSDYTAVMSGGKKGIYSFIDSNDKDFFFLTEIERIMRWDNIKDKWEDLKASILENETVDRNELLNAFQYEKQILLRSALKVKEALNRSGDGEATAMLDSLLQIKMAMTVPMTLEERYKQLEADYQRVQKYLMHHRALEEFNGSLYQRISTHEISSKLKDDETFIDFGKMWNAGQYRYVALIITRDCPEGKMQSLLAADSLRKHISRTEADDSKTMVRLRYEDSFLYENLWKPIENTGLIKDKILYCPTDELNAIMPDAIKAGENYLGENHEFHIISSSESIDNIRWGENYKPNSIISFCGIDYVGDREELIRIAQKFGSERPLKKNLWDSDDYNNPGIHIKTSVAPLDTEEDYQWLRDLGKEHNTQIGLLTGERANEYIFKQLGTYRGTANISTHAFNLPRGYNDMGNHYVTTQFIRIVSVEPFTTDLLPLYRTGLFFSGAERSWTGRNYIDDIEDGILNGEEISYLDLSGLELVTLMACSTGKGEVDEYEGIIGIRRALKMAGCRSLVTTAWNLDKEAAMTYLKTFYGHLVKGDGISLSHRKAQLELIKKYEDPYYWALFQLID